MGHVNLSDPSIGSNHRMDGIHANAWDTHSVHPLLPRHSPSTSNRMRMRHLHILFSLFPTALRRQLAEFVIPARREPTPMSAG